MGSIVTEWPVVEAALKLLENRPVMHALAWKTALYEFMVHKQFIMVLLARDSNGRVAKVHMFPVSNEKYDNHEAWPKDVKELKFVLDGHEFPNFETYYAAKAARYHIHEDVLRDPRKWWLNGHLLCNTAGQWSTRGLDVLQAMLEKVCLHQLHLWPVFFINRRDFPHHTLSTQVTAFHIFGPCPERPMFFNVDKVPILSFYGSPNYQDILIPTPESWTAASISSATAASTSSWPKKPQAVFRGTLTGRYTDCRNTRLQVLELGHKRPDLLDAALTAWTPRDRIEWPYVTYNGPPTWVTRIGPSFALSQAQQAQYAILIYVPGHVASCRLDWYLRSGCCTVMVYDEYCAAPQQYHDTVSEKLEAGKHYMEATMYNLESLLTFLLAHPERCEEIGLEAQRWALTHLRQDAMVDTMRRSLSVLPVE